MNYEEMIKTAGKRYKTNFYEDEINASRELLQYCALSALSEAGLFEKAAFLGGTSLRLFRGLDRFSEDLDFSLMKADSSFELAPFLHKAEEILNSRGLNVEIKDKSKVDVNVKKAFLRDSSVPRMLEFGWATRKTDTPQKINVKIEVDSNPPECANYEEKIIPFPEKQKITLFDMPSAFAGKCHALLTRKYIKGRDWYDFLFYVNQKIVPNYRLLTNALIQTGDYSEKVIINNKILSECLDEKIENLNMNAIIDDLSDFITSERISEIEKFDKDLFHRATKNLFEYSAEQQNSLEAKKQQKKPESPSHDDGLGR